MRGKSHQIINEHILPMRKGRLTNKSHCFCRSSCSAIYIYISAASISDPTHLRLAHGVMFSDTRTFKLILIHSRDNGSDGKQRSTVGPGRVFPWWRMRRETLWRNYKRVFGLRDGRRRRRRGFWTCRSEIAYVQDCSTYYCGAFDDG